MVDRKVWCRRGRTRGKPKGFDGLSKEELYELAKEADIAGRSEMSKEQLVEALEAA